MKYIILVALTLTGLTQAKAKPLISVVTSIQPSDCTIFEQSTEDDDIDFFSSKCTGFNKYQIFIDGSDLRYLLSIRYQDHFLDTPNPSGGFIGITGNSIEWRIEGDSFSGTPKALIYSISGSYSDEHSYSKVILVKLDKTEMCTVAELTVGPKLQSDVFQAARELSNSIEEFSCEPKVKEPAQTPEQPMV